MMKEKLFAVLVLNTTLLKYAWSTWLGINIPIRLADRRGDICTSASLPTLVTSYAINIQPEVVSPNVEHITLYACAKPRTYKRYWYCNKQPPCGLSDGVVIYSWAKGIPDVPLPLNVGFRLGGRTPWKYLVLQVFYSDDGSEIGSVDRIALDEDSDSDGVSLQLTTKPQKYVAGIYSFFARSIPTGEDQAGCPYQGNKMVPFAYRHGRNCWEWDRLLAYRVQTKEWSLINTPTKVETNEQLGTFKAIPSDDMMVIKPGDFLTASWVKNVAVSIPAVSDARVEECRLHLLYYTTNNALSTNLHTTCKLLLSPTLVKNLPSNEQHHQHHQRVTEVETHSNPAQTIAASAKDIRNASGFARLPTTTATTQSLITVAAKDSSLEMTKIEIASVSANYGGEKEIQSTSSTPPHQLGASVVVKGSLVNLQARHIVDEWWSTLNISIGTICGIGVNANGKNLYTLHRGDRNITAKSFDDEYYYKDFDKPIYHSTIALVDTATHQLKQLSGNGLFYLPYSLTVDDRGNVWVTDIGLHQVFKFSSTLQKLLVLGTTAIPGTDVKHFCKPCDVAVDGKGYVYIADGLCNQRIMKFDQHGHLMKEWSGHLNTPYNIVLDNGTGMLFVLDTHDYSIIQYDTEGNFIKIIGLSQVNHQPIQSIAFTGIGDFLYTLASESQCLGQIISTLSGDVVTTWRLILGHSNGPCHLAKSPHDMELYVASGRMVSKMALNKVKPVQKEDILDERVTEDNYYSEIRIIKASEDENHIRTALIVVVVLGTPVVLSILMMLVQYIILKLRHRKVRMKRNLHRERRGSGVWCHGCCVTRKHYFQSNGGMEEFMINSNCEDSGSEEELFARKT